MIGVACITGDHDLVSGFACPKCYEQLRTENEALKVKLGVAVECLENMAQWHGDKVSIVPSVALKHYAKDAVQALQTIQGDARAALSEGGE